MIELPDYTKSEIEELSQDFKEGVYDFKTLSFTNKASKKSGNMMTELVLVFDGPGFEFNIWEYFMHHMITDPGHVMHKNTIKRIAKYLEGVGIAWSPHAFKESTAVGAEGSAFVGLVKEKGSDTPRRKIKYFVKKGSDIALPANPEEKASTQVAIGPIKPKEKQEPTFDDDIPF